MNKFEQGPSDREKFTTYSEKVEEIALQASEMPEFQEAVKNAKGKLEAIKNVRILLREHFPEIEDLPKPEQRSEEIPESKTPIRRKGILPPASNEFMIAKNIVDLLYENK